MNTNCICLEYIHDNGPCPIHGQPPTVDEEKELHINPHLQKCVREGRTHIFEEGEH